MARIAGVDLPNNKRGEIGLTYIFGIGRSSAQRILDACGIDRAIKVGDWDDTQIAAIRAEVGNNYLIGFVVFATIFHQPSTTLSCPSQTLRDRLSVGLQLVSAASGVQRRTLRTQHRWQQRMLQRPHTMLVSVK